MLTVGTRHESGNLTQHSLRVVNRILIHSVLSVYNSAGWLALSVYPISSIVWVAICLALILIGIIVMKGRAALHNVMHQSHLWITASSQYYCPAYRLGNHYQTYMNTTIILGIKRWVSAFTTTGKCLQVLHCLDNDRAFWSFTQVGKFETAIVHSGT